MPEASDELVERILAAAADLSDQRVEALIAQATTEAEAEVKQLLKSTLKAALLQRALIRLGATAPGGRPELACGRDDSASNETACYVYCVAADDHPVPDMRQGIVSGGPIQSVSQGGLQAIVNRVPLDQFGQSALDHNAQDARWVEQKARAHDAVLKTALASGPILPLRFCTILRDADAVRDVLAFHQDDLRAALASVAGKKEWGAKFMMPEEAVAPELRSGREYLATRQRQVRGREVQDAGRLAKEWHQKLAAVASDSTLLPLGRDAASAVVLNAAYLVRDPDEPGFHSLARRFAEPGREQLTCEVTGPWPPYNFVHLDLSLPRRT